MKKYNIITKIILYISFLSGVIWTGSYLLRMFLFYQLFKVKDFELKDQFANIDLLPVFNVLLPAVSTTFVSYILFLVTFTAFIFLSRISLKENGWLFISLMIIAVTAPFEIYLMTLDADYITGIFYSTMSSQNALELVIKRFKVLSSFQIIELLGFFAIFYLVLFKPLTRKNEN